MHRVIAAAVLVTVSATPLFAQDVDGRATLEQEVRGFLTAWTGGSNIASRDVDRFYEPTVLYYGRSETRSQVLAEKRFVAKRWPDRAYRLLPGSAHSGCNPAHTRCNVTAVLTWRAENPARATRSFGAATVALDLVRDGAVLKIAHEDGHTLIRRR